MPIYKFEKKSGGTYRRLFQIASQILLTACLICAINRPMYFLKNEIC